MKKLFLTVLVAATVVLPLQAQMLFSPDALGGAAFGAMLGGIFGGDSHSHGCYYHNEFSGKGAAIGAGIGLLTGALLGEANRRQAEAASWDSAGYVPQTAGYGYSGGGPAYVYYAPNAYTAPGYYYRPNARPNYAVNGTLLGAASGALIGAGNEQAGKGAAIGAASGLVLGGIAEIASRKRERRIATNPPTQVVQQTQPAAATYETKPQSDNSRGTITSKPCATSTYTWTPRPQIPDAPTVANAKTF